MNPWRTTRRCVDADDRHVSRCLLRAKIWTSQHHMMLAAGKHFCRPARQILCGSRQRNCGFVIKAHRRWLLCKGQIYMRYAELFAVPLVCDSPQIIALEGANGYRFWTRRRCCRLATRFLLADTEICANFTDVAALALFELRIKPVGKAGMHFFEGLPLAGQHLATGNQVPLLRNKATYQKHFSCLVAPHQLGNRQKPVVMAPSIR